MQKPLLLLVICALTLSLVACERRDQRRPEPDSSTEEPASTEDTHNNDFEPEESRRDPAAEAEDREVELAVRDCMAALRTASPDDIDRHLEYWPLLGLEEGQPDTNLRALLTHMDYEIDSAQADGVIGRATVRISNIDMNEVLGDYLKAAMDMEYNNGIAEAPKSPGEMELEYQRLFEEMLDENEASRREMTLDIAVSQIDGWWRVQPDEELRAALFGDYFAAQKALGPNAGGGQR